jgi:hypothetical protein
MNTGQSIHLSKRKQSHRKSHCSIHTSTCSKKPKIKLFNTPNLSSIQDNFGTPLSKMRRIQKQRHRDSAQSSSNRNSHDPSRHEQADTLPIDGLVGSVAEANTHRGAGDAHGGRDGEGELREDEDGDGGAHFHAAAARGGVVGDFVAHNCKGLLLVGAQLSCRC